MSMCVCGRERERECVSVSACVFVCIEMPVLLTRGDCDSLALYR